MTRQPHDVHLLGRGLAAGVATEILLGLGLVALARALQGAWTDPTGAVLSALAAGLAGGLAWGVTEVAARRARRAPLLVGLVVGAPLALTVPLASAYALHLRAEGHSLAALQGLGDDLPAARDALWLVSAALCLHLPLLAVRRRGPRGVGREVWAMSLGLIVWLGAAAVAGAAGGRLHLSLLLLPVVARPFAFPLALRAGDALCALVARLARGDAPDARAGASRRAPTPLERHRARWHEERGRALLAAGRAADAAAELGRAHGLWPEAERALLLAEARARAGAVAPAVEALLAAADLAGGRPRGWDPSASVWAVVRGHAAVEALAVCAASRLGRGAPSPGARLALAAWALTVTAGVAAPALVAPDEPAAVTRLRALAWVTGDAARWRAVAEALEDGVVDVPAAWPALDLLHAGPAREPAPEGVLFAYLRAAEGGDVGAMLQAADRLACYPGRGAEALGWIRRAAEAGEPRAMTRLGAILCRGWPGVARDEAEGRRWWTRAAAAGVAEARVELTRWEEQRGVAVSEAADGEGGR